MCLIDTVNIYAKKNEARGYFCTSNIYVLLAEIRMNFNLIQIKIHEKLHGTEVHCGSTLLNIFCNLQLR